jgi:DivIVA domain-containing protein
MELTPEDLREVEFRERFRGYDPDEVDDFLERAAAGLAELRARVRELTERAEKAEEELHGPQQGSWLGRIERELTNLQSALSWAIEREDAALALRLAGSQTWYWYHAMCGAWAEGRLWLERALSLPGGRAAPRPRARALAGAMLLAQFQGDLAAARTRVAELVAVGEELEEGAVLLLARGAMAQLLLVTGDFAAAERMDDEALELAYRLDDAWSACRKLANKAYCALHRGDPASARAYLVEGADLARQTGDTWSLAMALGELGDLERIEGAHERAGVLYTESLTLQESLGIGERSPSLVHNLGYVALAQHDTNCAAARFADALQQFHWRGDRRGIAECIIGLGAVAAAKGEADTAVQLFGAAEAALESLSTQLWPSNRSDYDRWVGQTRADLSASTFDSLWSEGRRLSLDEAVALALSGEV